MPSVRELKVGGVQKDRGVFHTKAYNIFNPEEADEYADLRTRASDASSGVQIERIEQYARKTTFTQGEGAERTSTTTEDMYLMVQYWEKDPVRDKGDHDDDIKEARLVWSKEREASG